MLFIQKETIIYPTLSYEKEAKPICELSIPKIPVNLSFTYSKDLQKTLQGRKLLLDEIPYPIEDIQVHFENGYVRYHYGVHKEKASFHCGRCGNEKDDLFGSFLCARCQKKCVYCRKCITMGRVSQCTPLVSWAGPVDKFIYEDPLEWRGQLSKGQQLASDELVRSVEEKSDRLIWAVCGAGKTEVLFEGIATALATGKYTCIATPRTDVVIELVPRLKQAFPEVNITALYGGSEDERQLTPLTVATTHQLLRFHKAFDMVVIDEVDAFPFSFEPMLKRAVEQVKRERSSTIYLTATPDKEWRRKVEKKTLSAVTIPARYHGFPLPVPEFKWCGNWKKSVVKKQVPPPISTWITEKLEAKRQSFLFIPSIQLLEEILPLLKAKYPNIEGVHSKDSFRKEKVQLFRKGEIPILLTTTILERGVTVPKTDVAVLGADDPVFTESALVQISGRVGRSSADPSGEILFFHYGKTDAMVAARKQILSMNKQASERGLLTGGQGE
ncbi:DEAD/DEAH box helicase [Bacillus sp. DJP31]|uniref:DEAD/DEAH box helicase n=1 Tax=Bacillus sp. DJP31 TaxID=3409789 RepID=UPI003BB48CAF